MLLKRRFAAMLAVLMLFTLTACAAGTDNPASGDTEQADATNSVTVEASSADASSEDTAQDTADVSGDEEINKKVEAILSGMSLKDKVEQMLLVSFRVIDEENVTALNDDIRTVLTDHHFGGTVLFSENIKDAEQTVKLICDMQETNLAGGGLPLFVAADQEGGNVARIGFGTTGVGNMALAATNDTENARKMATVYGEELSLLGINTDFAPVLDVNNNPHNPVIGVRSFSDSPDVAAAFGLSYIAGLHDTNTIATVKHFPGHGNTDTDSHTGFPLIESSYEDLQSVELIPFQQAIDAGADMVMTAHIQYPQIETETYTSVSTGEPVCLPATMSKTILTDILRDDMGFTGVVVSDALDMAAIADNFAEEDILALTIHAGVDLLILPPAINAEAYEKMLSMAETAVQLAEEGVIDATRIDDSVRRILTLKAKYGLLDRTDFTATQDMIDEALQGTGSAEHLNIAWDIADDALTLVKNEDNAFPLDLNAGETVLLLFADSCASRSASGLLAEQMLRENGALPDDVTVTTLVNTADNEAACVQAAKDADHTILIHRMYGADNLNPYTEDGFSSAVFDRVIEALHETGKQAVLICCQLPYDAARFPEADAVLLTYNSSVMREVPPASGEGSAYMPNLVAAIRAACGDGNATGRLPVNIPALDETYAVTDDVLYARE